MADYAALVEMARARHLDVLGALHPAPEDDVPPDTGTLILLGPHEPGFWAHFTASPEYCDTQPDPVDRWSRRVLGGMARELGGTPLFPFGGPPHRPFYNWALRSGRAWASPMRMLVHDTTGLLVSYRGALALTERLALPPPSVCPCATCDESPCLTTCPVTALTPQGYDLPRCHGFLDQPEGQDCMQSGCAARRTCPVSKDYARLPEHSAYHMRLFHP